MYKIIEQALRGGSGDGDDDDADDDAAYDDDADNPDDDDQTGGGKNKGKGKRKGRGREKPRIGGFWKIRWNLCWFIWIKSLLLVENHICNISCYMCVVIFVLLYFWLNPFF